MLEIMYHTVLFAMRYCLLDKRERERCDYGILQCAVNLLVCVCVNVCFNVFASWCVDTNRHLPTVNVCALPRETNIVMQPSYAFMANEYGIANK